MPSTSRRLAETGFTISPMTISSRFCTDSKAVAASPVASAMSLLVFFVLAMQCLSTVVTVRRETKSWRWPLLQFAWMTGLAWIGAFVVYQSLRAAGVS